MLVWIPILAVWLFLLADLLILRGPMAAQGSSLYGVILVRLCVAAVWTVYCTAYSVRFNGTTREVLWINLFLVLSHPVTALGVLVILAVGAMLALMIPYLMLFLPAVISLVLCGPMERMFRKHMRPEDVARLEQEEQP